MLKLARIDCATSSCRTKFRPTDRRVRRCDTCRATRRLLQPAAPPRPPQYQTRTCTACAGEYQPTSSRQAVCAACRAGRLNGTRCAVCGSPVSGRARWGASWTGECDRAAALTEAMSRRKAAL